MSLKEEYHSQILSRISAKSGEQASTMICLPQNFAAGYFWKFVNMWFLQGVAELLFRETP